MDLVDLTILTLMCTLDDQLCKVVFNVDHFILICVMFDIFIFEYVGIKSRDVPLDRMVNFAINCPNQFEGTKTTNMGMDSPYHVQTNMSVIKNII